jgi:hypothetical protein
MYLEETNAAKDLGEEENCGCAHVVDVAAALHQGSWRSRQFYNLHRARLSTLSSLLASHSLQEPGALLLSTTAAMAQPVTQTIARDSSLLYGIHRYTWAQTARLMML